MNGWLKPKLHSQKIHSMRIFINLDDFFHSLFKPTINSEFELCGKDCPKQFLSNVLNLLGHYRYWAVKQGYDVEVYGYFTFNSTFKNAIFIPQYRDKSRGYWYGQKYFYVAHAMKESIQLIETISKYIPKVYIIDAGWIEPSIIPAYIDSTKQVDLNLIISRDIYDLQYAYQDGWMYISPKGDQSSFVHRGNLWDYINYKEHIYSGDNEIHYPEQLLVIAKAITGDKYRNIPRLRSIGWKTFFRYVNEVQEKIQGNSIILLEMQLKELLKGKLITDSELQQNINCVDIHRQIDMISTIDASIISNQIVDVEDYENLKMLNQRHLYRHPLNLKFLCDTIQMPMHHRKNQW